MLKALEYLSKALLCALVGSIAWFWPHDWLRTVALWLAGIFIVAWGILAIIQLIAHATSGH